DALKAYLDTVEPVENEVRQHDLIFPFGFRPFIYAWRIVNFDSGERVADPDRSEQWNRGAYLVNHLGHCGACHTPKDFVYNFLDFMFLGGSDQIPGPLPAPNISPDPATGIGDWSHDDVTRALKRAIRPDGTPIRGSMAEYVATGSSHLNDEDLDAMAVYLRTVEPQDRSVE
ncbi:MAG TPA: cytochrome c, partial [Alphaproteobacteria bacterium]|nr:cytochrome c [Alphaproteobacteria bacterium]